MISGDRVSSAQLGRARDLFAHDHAHAAADERVLHRGHDHRHVVERAAPDEHRVVHAADLDRGLEPVLVRFRVNELQRVVRAQPGIVLGVLARVEEHLEAVAGAHPEMVPALRAHLEAGSQFFVVDRPAARRTLHPEAFGHPARLGRGGHGLSGLLEPRHTRNVQQDAGTELSGRWAIGQLGNRQSGIGPLGAWHQADRRPSKLSVRFNQRTFNDPISQ